MEKLDYISLQLSYLREKSDIHSELLAKIPVQIDNQSKEISEIKTQLIRDRQTAMTLSGQSWMSVGIISSFSLGVINMMKSVLGGH